MMRLKQVSQNRVEKIAHTEHASIDQVAVYMFWLFFKILSHSVALTEARIEIRSIMQAHVLATVLLLIQEGNCRLVSDHYTEPNLPVE